MRAPLGLKWVWRAGAAVPAPPKKAHSQDLPELKSLRTCIAGFLEVFNLGLGKMKYPPPPLAILRKEPAASRDVERRGFLSLDVDCLVFLFWLEGKARGPKDGGKQAVIFPKGVFGPGPHHIWKWRRGRRAFSSQHRAEALLR